MNTSIEKWHVIYTYPNFEKKVNKALLQKGINAYLPLHLVKHKWSDRIKQLSVPLFPNYVFVNISKNQYSRVMSTDGVLRFVSFGHKPAEIHHMEIEIIRRLENNCVAIENDFVQGEAVKIVEGPFAGIEGVLSEKYGKNKVIVLLNNLRKQLSVEISPSSLVKLAPVYSI